MNSPRVVYDTMVFLQAAIHPERRYATVEAVEDNRLRLYVSSELMAEVRDVLSRPRMAAKFPALTAERVARFMEKMSIIATAIDPVPSAFTWPQHSDDDHVFNLAIAAQANFLVTWETRILKLATSMTPSGTLLRKLAPGLSIVTPAELAAHLSPRAE
jgi:putative PIN family toxin of toxin-antitoxin system